MTPTPPAPSPRWRPLDLAALAVSVALSAGFALSVWRTGLAYGITLPLGSDGTLWYDTARLLGTGATVAFAPLYPRLVWWGSGWGELVEAGLAINAAAVGCTLLASGLAAAAAATAPWTRRAALVGAPLLVLGVADPAAYAWFLHPESLTAALLVVTAGAALAFTLRPTALRAGLLGLAVGLALDAREHGLVLALLAPVLVVVHSPRQARLGTLLAVALGMAPFLFDPASSGGAWTKAETTLQESLSWLLPGGADRAPVPVEMSQAQRTQLRASGGILVFAAQAWTSIQSWWWVFLGSTALAAAAAWRTRDRTHLALALPLLSLAPALLVWTEPRHYLVVAPAAVVLGVGTAARWLSPHGMRGAAGLLVACGGLALAGAPRAGAELTGVLAEVAQLQRERADEYLAVMWMLEHLEPDARVGTDLDPYVIHKVPFLPEEAPGMTDETPLYYASLSEPSSGHWALVHTAGRVQIHRRLPAPPHRP